MLVQQLFHTSVLFTEWPSVNLCFCGTTYQLVVPDSLQLCGMRFQILKGKTSLDAVSQALPLFVRCLPVKNKTNCSICWWCFLLTTEGKGTDPAPDWQQWGRAPTVHSGWLGDLTSISVCPKCPFFFLCFILSVTENEAINNSTTLTKMCSFQLHNFPFEKPKNPTFR